MARAGVRALLRAPQPQAERWWMEDLVARLSLPDGDNQPVLAAAIAGDAEVLMTLNRADFPTRTLARHGIVLRQPDGFLVELLADVRAIGAVAEAVRVRAEHA